jgi:hypothetical protein
VPDCCDAGVPCDGPSPITVDDDLADFPQADFTSIQDAIDSASDGDEILVYPGIYFGSGDYVINMGSKRLALTSVGGADETLVDGQNSRGGLHLDGEQGHETVIQGFSFAHCITSDGVYIVRFSAASGPLFADCVVRDSVGVGLGSGPYHLGDPVGHAHILRCVFENIDSTGSNTISFNYNEPVIEDCVFRGNQARYLAFSYWPNNLPTYINCLFEANSVGSEGLIHPRSGSMVTLQGCEFRDNAMAVDCVLGESLGGLYEVSDTRFCGNSPGNGICASWNDLGGNTFEDSCGPECVADILEDGEVTIEDLLIVLAQYGTPGPEADIDGNGVVDIEDLLVVVGSWGACP